MNEPHSASPAFWVCQGYALVIVTFMSFFPSWYHFQEYLFFAMLGSVVGYVCIAKQLPTFRTSLDIPIILFVAWILFTVPFAADPFYSFSEWRKFCARLLVFYWAVIVLRNWKEANATQSVVWAIVAGAGGLAAYALIVFVETGGTWRDRVIRASAPSSDYNWLTTYMVVAIPIVILAIATSGQHVKRLLGIGGLALAFVAQIFAYTRAGWLSLGVEGIVFGLYRGRRRVLLWISGGFVGTGALLLAVSQLGYQKETLDPWTLNARIGAWQLGIHEIAEHPIVGIGYGNDTFAKVHPEYSALDPREHLILTSMHNMFMMVAVGSGLPALVLFAWIFLRISKVLVRQARGHHDARIRYLSVALTVVLAGFIVRNLFDYMFIGSLAHLFWILVAMGLYGEDNQQVLVSAPLSDRVHAGKLPVEEQAEALHIL